MSDSLVLLAALSLFHVIGGAIAGRSLRIGFGNGWSCNLLSRIFSGLVFGLFPLFFGVFQFFQTGSASFVLIQISVFLASFVLVLVASEWVLETFNPQIFGPILFGGGFMVVGVVIFLSLRGDSLRDALIGFTVFGGSGALVLVLSAVKALKG